MRIIPMIYRHRFGLFFSCLMASFFYSWNAFAVPMMEENSDKHHKHAPVPQSNDEQEDNPSLKDDTNPTQSLFNAINAGRLNEAKDALNRGADLRAKNVLGQTPLDMSIDLNRDRITFLLLSMRGYDNSPQSLMTSTTSTSSKHSGIDMKNGKGHLSVHGKSNKHIYTKNQTQQPRYGSDNGVAKPEIGFLGFGPS
ncbi:MAG: hypothetical protein M3Z67_04365 [Commensalibacter sp.]|nr:hypothetical protein [Commensalibacter sp.]